jgi:hypothetical protein
VVHWLPAVITTAVRTSYPTQETFVSELLLYTVIEEVELSWDVRVNKPDIPRTTVFATPAAQSCHLIKYNLRPRYLCRRRRINARHCVCMFPAHFLYEPEITRLGDSVFVCPSAYVITSVVLYEFILHFVLRTDLHKICLNLILTALSSIWILFCMTPIYNFSS